jgi:hypothetical protein
MELGSSDTGIRFYTPSDAVIPANPSTNSARDAAIDLGISSQRFKDLYLSGGVYLGGTVAANYLDDYKGDKPMALTEKTIEDKIEVVGDYKHVQVRTARCISDNGVEISRSFSRKVIGPLDDASGESAEVQAICAVVHTDAIKEAYTELLAQQALGV